MPVPVCIQLHPKPYKHKYKTDENHSPTASFPSSSLCSPNRGNTVNIHWHPSVRLVVQTDTHLYYCLLVAIPPRCLYSLFYSNNRVFYDLAAVGSNVKIVTNTCAVLHEKNKDVSLIWKYLDSLAKYRWLFADRSCPFGQQKVNEVWNFCQSCLPDRRHGRSNCWGKSSLSLNNLPMCSQHHRNMCPSTSKQIN